MDVKKHSNNFPKKIMKKNHNKKIFTYKNFLKINIKK